MSEARSPVHDARSVAFKPMQFLDLSRPTGGFNPQVFRSQIDNQAFQRKPVQAMPDHSHTAGAYWRPAASANPAAGAAAGAVTPDLALSNPAEAQGESGALDEQLAEHIRNKAFNEGLQQGLREGEAQAMERLRSQTEAQQQQQFQDLQALLERLNASVASLRQEPDTLYEPLKRLALHLAEELVLGELQAGAEAIDRLVQRCVDELQAAQNANVCVELHPRDLQSLQSRPELEADRPNQWRWEANDSLLPGSVRVRVDDSTVTDLIEHRLQSLAQSLLGQPQRWAAQTAFRSDRIAERFVNDTPVSDVQPRASLGGLNESPWPQETQDD